MARVAHVSPPSSADPQPSSHFLRHATLHEGYYVIGAYGLDPPHDLLDGPYYCVDDRAMIQQVSALADWGPGPARIPEVRWIPLATMA
jgi:hypothetical protein